MLIRPVEVLSFVSFRRSCWHRAQKRDDIAYLLFIERSAPWRHEHGSAGGLATICNHVLQVLIVGTLPECLIREIAGRWVQHGRIEAVASPIGAVANLAVVIIDLATARLGLDERICGPAADSQSLDRRRVSSRILAVRVWPATAERDRPKRLDAES